MAVNPLLARAESRLTAATQANTNTETALAAARTEVDTRTSTYNQKLAEMALLAQEIEQIRRELQRVDSQADGEALSAELQQKIVELRNKQGEAVDAERALAIAKTAAARAGAVAAAARAELANATSGLNEAKSADARRNALKNAVASAPVADVPAAATAALASAAFTAADGRITADFPAGLLSLARARAGVESSVLAAAKKKVADTTAALEAVQTDVEKHRAALARAEAGLSAYINTAKVRFDDAEARIARVGDAAEAPLSQAERDSIHDPATLGAREAAAALAAAVAAAVTTAVDSGVELEDTPGDPGVQAAEAAFDAPSRTQVEEWEATVPDATWMLLADFETARETLDALATGAAALITAMDTAEANLANALTAEATAAATLTQLRGSAQDAASLYEAALAAYPARLLSALRGDD